MVSEFSDKLYDKVYTINMCDKRICMKKMVYVVNVVWGLTISSIIAMEFKKGDGMHGTFDMQSDTTNQLSSSYSWMNPKLEVQRTSNGQLGIFTQDHISKGERLIVYGGTIMTESEVMSLNKEQIPYVLQIDDDLWLSSNKPNGYEKSDYLNHSCDPNAGFKSPITLIALRDIHAGEEIAIDYAMVVERFVGMSDFPCFCKVSCCRKMVSGNDWKNKDIQEKYHGYFSPYLQDKIDLNT